MADSLYADVERDDLDIPPLMDLAEAATHIYGAITLKDLQTLLAGYELEFTEDEIRKAALVLENAGYLERMEEMGQTVFLHPDAQEASVQACLQGYPLVYPLKYFVDVSQGGSLALTRSGCDLAFGLEEKYGWQEQEALDTAVDVTETFRSASVQPVLLVSDGMKISQYAGSCGPDCGTGACLGLAWGFHGRNGAADAGGSG